MCSTLVVDYLDIEIETLGELMEVGIDPVLCYPQQPVDLESCLCQIDLEATLEKYKIPWMENDWPDYSIIFKKYVKFIFNNEASLTISAKTYWEDIQRWKDVPEVKLIHYTNKLTL